MAEGPRRGRPRIDPGLDNYGVHDARERKRKQDRLAQRARRRRLASQASTSNQTTDRPSAIMTEATSPPDPARFGNALSAALQQQSPQTSMSSQVLSSLARTLSEGTSPAAWMRIMSYLRVYPLPRLTLDHRLLGWPAWPIFAALHTHALMMMQGTTCSEATEEAKSPLHYLELLPDPLKPTPLQLAIPHPRWFDRFPFPRFRDNMILLIGLVDLDEFTRDVFSMAGLILRTEVPRASWDPDAWTISAEFGSKWGYLFL